MVIFIQMTVSTWLRNHHTTMLSRPFWPTVWNMFQVVNQWRLIHLAARKSCLLFVMVRTSCLLIRLQVLKLANIQVCWPLLPMIQTSHWVMVLWQLTWVNSMLIKHTVHCSLVLTRELFPTKVMRQQQVKLSIQMLKGIWPSQVTKSKVTRL